MAAPVLANRSVAFVNKVGTDDAGYNAVGRPESFLTIAAALADLAANYPTASLTNPHVVAVGPGVFTTAAFALPPFTFIEGSADDESGTTSILSMTGNITLAAAWSVNATKNGGLTNLVIRAAEGTPVIDLTVPTPAAGNPTRTVEIENIRTDLDRVDFEATSTNDRLNVQRLVHDGSNTNDVELSGGTQSINNFQSAAIVTLNDTAGVGCNCQAYGIFITNASSSLRCISTGASFTTIRLGACDNRNLFLSETAPGVITVSADAVSIPLTANVTYGGTATSADLIRTTDINAISGGIVGPAVSTLNAFVIWDNTTGTLVRDSAATLSAIAANTVTFNVPGADLLLASVLGTGATLRLGRAAGADLTATPGALGSLVIASGTRGVGFNSNGSATHGIGPSGNNVSIASNGAATAVILQTNTGAEALRAQAGQALFFGLSTNGTGAAQFPAGTTSAGGITLGDASIYQNATRAVTVSASSDIGFKIRTESGGRNINASVVDGTNSALIQLTSFSAGAVFKLGTNTAGCDVQLTVGASTTALTLENTSLNATFAGPIIGAVQALSGAGAVNVSQLHTSYTSTGPAEALTLANGTAGQVKTITHTVDGGSGILTPTTKVGFTTITFTNAGDSVTLRYTTSGWAVIGSFGVLIA